MGVMFSENDAQRISSVVRRVERMPKVFPSNGRRPNQTPIQATVIRGKLDNQLNKDGSATLSVWWFNGTSEVDSGHNVTVHDWLLKTGQSIASGKKVVASFCGGRYYVTSTECS